MKAHSLYCSYLHIRYLHEFKYLIRNIRYLERERERERVPLFHFTYPYSNATHITTIFDLIFNKITEIRIKTSRKKVLFSLRLKGDDYLNDVKKILHLLRTSL